MGGRGRSTSSATAIGQKISIPFRVIPSHSLHIKLAAYLGVYVNGPIKTPSIVSAPLSG